MNTIAFPNMDEIEENAAIWIAKIDRGMSADEQIQLEEWLAASAVHGEVLINCASMWDLLDVLKPIANLMPIQEGLNAEQPHHTSAQNAHRSKAVMIAASFLVLIAGLIFTNLPVETNRALPPLVEVNTEVKPIATQVYKTAVGEISTVSLSDGSTLELNTDSEVIAHFTDSQRTLELVQGEVYFDVAKDASKPFVVEVGSDKVTAIGTAFSINASEPLGDKRSVLEVIVTHGKVRVTTDNSDSPLYLEYGQKAVAKDAAFEVSNNADSASSLAWRDGMVVFQGESLTEVVRELNRYSPRKFRLLDQELKSISVGGFFKTGDLDQLLVVLESNFGVSSQIVGDEIRLTKSK